MGMAIFEQSGTFDPAQYGLSVGDVLQVVCVGGGSSGAGVSGSSKANSNPGGTSSFGSFLSSESGRKMGTGGSGVTIDNKPYSGGGAGGYLPGVPIDGGNGGDINCKCISGLAGMSARGNDTTFFAASPYCNTNGEGNRGAGVGRNTASGIVAAAGGNGYGAGGSGAAYPSTSSNTFACDGGDAGNLSLGVVALESTAVIAVTVGVGGAAAGTSYASGKGANGVVVVTW